MQLNENSDDEHIEKNIINVTTPDKCVVNNNNNNNNSAVGDGVAGAADGIISSGSNNNNNTITTPNPVENLNLKDEKYEISAKWRIPLKGKCFQIELEHGSVTGKRIIRVDGKEVFRKDWMFKLVGDDVFYTDDVQCVIRVDPAPGFKFYYSLIINGKPYTEFNEKQAKILKTWETIINEKLYRIVLEKKSLNLFLNGKLREEMAEFVENGTDTKFIEDDNLFVLSVRLNSNNQNGLIHILKVNDVEIEESQNI